MLHFAPIASPRQMPQSARRRRARRGWQCRAAANSQSATMPKPAMTMSSIAIRLWMNQVKLVASILYTYVDLSDAPLEERARQMTVQERVEVISTYVGARSNRRHKPGRAFERPGYRFDVLADYGAFRDLQRHRMLTIEWQRLSPYHGFTRPEAVDHAGETEAFDSAMARSAELHDLIAGEMPREASYAVALAYKIRS